jgi:hypothetical protein
MFSPRSICRRRWQRIESIREMKAGVEDALHATSADQLAGR